MRQSLKSPEARVQELEGFLYAVDFTCRATRTPAEAVPLIERLCAAAKVPAVTWGRKVNEPDVAH